MLSTGTSLTKYAYAVIQLWPGDRRYAEDSFVTLRMNMSLRHAGRLHTRCLERYADRVPPGTYVEHGGFMHMLLLFSSAVALIWLTAVCR